MIAIGPIVPKCAIRVPKLIMISLFVIISKKLLKTADYAILIFKDCVQRQGSTALPTCPGQVNLEMGQAKVKNDVRAHWAGDNLGLLCAAFQLGRVIL